MLQETPPPGGPLHLPRPRPVARRGQAGTQGCGPKPRREAQLPLLPTQAPATAPGPGWRLGQRIWSSVLAGFAGRAEVGQREGTSELSKHVGGSWWRQEERLGRAGASDTPGGIQLAPVPESAACAPRPRCRWRGGGGRGTLGSEWCPPSRHSLGRWQGAVLVPAGTAVGTQLPTGKAPI